jgi:hypothetical protein
MIIRNLENEEFLTMGSSVNARMIGMAAMVVALVSVSETRAGLIVFSNPDAGLPTAAGNGLVGDYYRPTGGLQAGTLAVANAYINTHGTDATFVSTGINYPAGFTYGSGNTIGDGSSVATYLGTDANSLVATPGSPSGETTAQVKANTLDGTMYTFTGFLAITAAQVNVVQTFFLGSDDGSSFSIQGQLVVDNDGDHGFGFTSGGNTVEFTQAGLYAINVTYFEDGGNTGVELGSTLAGSGTFGGELTSANFYQTAPASVVPEPSSLALVGIAGAIAAGWMRRASRRARVS